MPVKKWTSLLLIKVRHVRRDQVQPSVSTGVVNQRRESFGCRAPPHTIAWNAVRTLGTVLSNSLLSASISWLLAFFIDQGNVFSGVTSNQQSYAEFLTAKMVWFWAFCWVFTIAECVAKLLPETFTSTPTPSTLSATRIVIKLVRAMLIHIIEVIIFSVGVGFGIATLPTVYRNCKADVYWPMMCYNFILTVTDGHTRHIFRVETVNGQTRAMRQKRRSRQPSQVESSRRSPSIAQFCRVFVQNLALVISGLSAGVFVHVTSVIEMRTKWQLVVFAISSQTLKLLIQGAAKYYLSKRSRTPSLRTMAIIVAAPTILVDTQLRTVLLCLDSKTVTLAGSVLLAIAKTALRLTTAMYMRHKTHQIMAQFPPREAHNGDLVIGKVHDTQSLRSSSVSLSTPELQGMATIHKLKGLHAAEVYADMHGEYIAMCCSYVIIICFGSDPRFLLGGNTSSSPIHSIEITTVLVQMGIEVVVDIVAVPLEIRFGVNCESFHKDGAFLTIFMVLVAVVNIHIASGIYLTQRNGKLYDKTPLFQGPRGIRTRLNILSMRVPARNVPRTAHAVMLQSTQMAPLGRDVLQDHPNHQEFVIALCSIVRRASRTLGKILRNSLMNASISWLLAFLISKGNILSGLSLEQQSYAEFVAVKITWFYGFFWVLTLAQSVFRLLPESFSTQSPPSTLSIFQVVSKLARPVLPYAVVITLLSIAGGISTAYLPAAFRKFKADLYWTLFCCSFIMGATGAYTYKIFRFETVKGQAQELRRLGQNKQQNQLDQLTPKPPRVQFLRSFCQSLPFIASALFAAGYVHIVQYIHITEQWQFAAFALCSLLLKLFVQDLAKRYLWKLTKTPSMRSMTVIVAAPTILVDTQLRTSLLCHSNVSSTLVSSVMLALVEITLRAAKTWHVLYQLRRILSPRPRTVIAVLPQCNPNEQLGGQPQRNNLVLIPTASSSNLHPVSSRDLAAQKLLSLHTAEVYADMCAEYIAMGSSYTILLFFGTNPKFQLGTSNEVTAAFMNNGYLATVSLQLGIEVVVDFVATSLELSLGVDFEIFNHDDVFLVIFMVGIATLNVHISSSVYLLA